MVSSAGGTEIKKKGGKNVMGRRIGYEKKTVRHKKYGFIHGLYLSLRLSRACASGSIHKMKGFIKKNVTTRTRGLQASRG